GAVASGGGEADDSDAFRQTSLETSRSRFTGTRSQVQRFGEAIQPEWSILKVATVDTAISDRDVWDANLLYHRYWLQDKNGAVSAAGALARAVSRGVGRARFPARARRFGRGGSAAPAPLRGRGGGGSTGALVFVQWGGRALGAFRVVQKVLCGFYSCPPYSFH